MAAKKQAAKAGAGAFAVGKAARDNPYVNQLIEDAELRDNLRTAYESARKAYGRINGKGPVKALTEDKKVQKELREAASSLRDAAETLRILQGAFRDFIPMNSALGMDVVAFGPDSITLKLPFDPRWIGNPETGVS